MKIKKWFCLTLVCVCILLSSQSVFADNVKNLSTYPQVWLDQLQLATPIKANEFYSGYLCDNGDYVDFYQWTNNTGHEVIVEAKVTSPYWRNYDIQIINPDPYGFIAGKDNGAMHATDSVSGRVPNGGIMLWRVIPHGGTDWDYTTVNYWTYFNVKPANY